MAKRVGVGYSDMHDQSHLCGQVGGGHAHGVINQAICCCYKAATCAARAPRPRTWELSSGSKVGTRTHMLISTKDVVQRTATCAARASRSWLSSGSEVATRTRREPRRPLPLAPTWKRAMGQAGCFTGQWDRRTSGFGTVGVVAGYMPH